MNSFDKAAAWSGFVAIQLPDFLKFAAEHPSLVEASILILKTVVGATIYHFVLRYWKKRDEKNNRKA